MRLLSMYSTQIVSPQKKSVSTTVGLTELRDQNFTPKGTVCLLNMYSTQIVYPRRKKLCQLVFRLIDLRKEN